MRKIRVALIGVGNCASSLVQGVEYYKNTKGSDFIPGVMHVDLGGYHIRDIEFVAAFDVDKSKVGKDLSKAIFVPKLKQMLLSVIFLLEAKKPPNGMLSKFSRRAVRSSIAFLHLLPAKNIGKKDSRKKIFPSLETI
jgi:myo-inositol-1-phosphate synthase